MMDTFRKQFFAGLVVVIPLGLTLYFIRLFYRLTSSTLLPILHQIPHIHIHDEWIRVISFVLIIVLIWGLGVFVSNWFGKWVVTLLERAISHVPFFRGFYEAVHKMTEAVFGAGSTFQAVVLIEYPDKDMYAIAFVTGHMDGVSFNSTEKYLCVFLPTVPNPTSGFVLYVPESKAIHVDLSIEEAAKILVSHGFVPIRPEAFQKKNP